MSVQALPKTDGTAAAQAATEMAPIPTLATSSQLITTLAPASSSLSLAGRTLTDETQIAPIQLGSAAAAIAASNAGSQASHAAAAVATAAFQAPLPIRIEEDEPSPLPSSPTAAIKGPSPLQSMLAQSPVHFRDS
jgi:hypothetical protein